MPFPTDSLAAPDLQIDRRGRLVNTTGDLLLDRMVTSASFWNASVVAHETGLTLWHAARSSSASDPDRRPLRGRLAERVRPDPRLAGEPAARGTGAPRSPSPSRFPHDWTETVHMRLGKATFAIAPGSRQRIVCWNATGPVDVVATTRNVLFDQANRTLSVQLSKTTTGARSRGTHRQPAARRTARPSVTSPAGTT